MRTPPPPPTRDFPLYALSQPSGFNNMGNMTSSPGAIIRERSRAPSSSPGDTILNQPVPDPKPGHEPVPQRRDGMLVSVSSDDYSVNDAVQSMWSVAQLAANREESLDRYGTDINDRWATYEDPLPQRPDGMPSGVSSNDQRRTTPLNTWGALPNLPPTEADLWNGSRLTTVIAGQSTKPWGISHYRVFHPLGCTAECSFTPQTMLSTINQTGNPRQDMI